MTDRTAADAGLADELGRRVEGLGASRARIMATANRERREFERGLHDGVQQDLVVLAVNLQLAEQAAYADPAALKRLLAEMRQQLSETIEAVRALARDVYPPLLTDLGVAAALRAAASGVLIPVQIEATPDRYPEDIEATVYFCCVAALDALSRVRPSGRGTIRLWSEDEWLLFEVRVEGPAATPHVSELESVYTGISDRIHAVGGTATMADGSVPGVRGTIPLAGPPLR